MNNVLTLRELRDLLDTVPPELEDQPATLVLHMQNGDVIVAPLHDDIERQAKRLDKIQAVKLLKNSKRADTATCWACRTPGVKFLATLRSGNRRRVCDKCASRSASRWGQPV